MGKSGNGKLFNYFTISLFNLDLKNLRNETTSSTNFTNNLLISH
jgi:hypothetical protein